ncbi:hypothetical protein [Arthrobacter sp. zg-Y1143]|uniref:hypothetical protein n=1 Tax=Arthrobacter sp. zg-Y1143 TaxID=3049065 RepID=UPI0024C3A0E3|nr:hypothetical protein [Arthrobacter sp. zg-Y1143]MDK1328468.1 hypothetical protein [Arthrobacter sp. zg-Y1143]
MQLLPWILICVVAAVVLRRHPAAAALAVVGLWFTVPAAGSYLLTGQADGWLSIHAATWLIFAILVVQLAFEPHVLADAAARHIYAVVVLATVLGAAILSTAVNGEGEGGILLVDQIVAPVLFFLFVVGNAARDARVVPWLRNGLLALAAFVCLVALAQRVTGNVLFYEEGFQTRYWFNPEGPRWMGLLDQPLTLSLAACVAAPLTVTLRRVWQQVALLALFGAGILVSQSRVGLVVIAAVVLYVAAATRKPVAARVGLVGVLGALVVWALSGPLAEGLLHRLEDDNGSAAARTSAVLTVLKRWPEFLFEGQGISGSYRVAEQGGLGTSLENSFLMYGVDLGLFFSMLYFGLLAVLVLITFRRTLRSGLAVAGLLAIAIPQTYSGLATRSAAAILLWTVIALVVAEGDRRVETDRPSGAGRHLGTGESSVGVHPHARPAPLAAVPARAAGTE